MQLEQITPLIITYNEAPNIERTLSALSWAQRIVVIDSFSTDSTIEILNRYPTVAVFQRNWDTIGNQWNYGLGKVSSPWVMSLDADYFVTKELIAEIGALPDDLQHDGYLVRFKYCVFGKPLRGTLLPPRCLLFKRSSASFGDDGHKQTLSVEGSIGRLASFVHHDDRKSLSRWLTSQDAYVSLEAEKFLNTPNANLSFADRLRRKKLFAPFIVLFLCLFIKRGVLDGWAGIYYAFQRTLAELLLAVRLIEQDQSWRKNQPQD